MLIWIDSITPKYAHFYHHLMPRLKALGHECLVTTRASANYTEAKAMLDLYGIAHVALGGHGGASPLDKFQARLERQQQFLDLFRRTRTPDALITSCMPDSSETAFGLGMPIFQLCDTPLRSTEFHYEDITLQTRISVPLASLLFHPFVLPSSIFRHLGLSEAQTFAYNFIDVCLWMKDIKRNPQNDFRSKLGLSLDRPVVFVREEEFKAHYVHEKLDLIYQLIEQLLTKTNYQIVMMPRYGTEHLRQRFGQTVTLIDRTLRPEEFYPFIDVMVGGGGTMNLEAACYGIPVLSMRSFKLFHDQHLIDNKLMCWTHDLNQALDFVSSSMGRPRQETLSYFARGDVDAELDLMVDRMHKHLQTKR